MALMMLRCVSLRSPQRHVTWRVNLQPFAPEWVSLDCQSMYGQSETVTVAHNHSNQSHKDPQQAAQFYADVFRPVREKYPHAILYATVSMDALCRRSTLTLPGTRLRPESYCPSLLAICPRSMERCRHSRPPLPLPDLLPRLWKTPASRTGIDPTARDIQQRTHPRTRVTISMSFRACYGASGATGSSSSLSVSLRNRQQRLSPHTFTTVLNMSRIGSTDISSAIMAATMPII